MKIQGFSDVIPCTLIYNYWLWTDFYLHLQGSHRRADFPEDGGCKLLWNASNHISVYL